MTRWNGTLLYSPARELLDALGVLGRKVRPQLDDDAAFGGVDDDGVGLVEAGRQGLSARGERGKKRGKHRGKNCETTDHENSGSGQVESAPLAGEFGLE